MPPPLCRTQFRVPADHPARAGHFPGNPVVPGVLLLEWVSGACSEAVRGLRIAGIPQVKFLAPLAFDERCELIVERLSEKRLQFKCSVGAESVARGILQVTSDAPADC